MATAQRQIAFFMNSPALGGAERSMIEQIKIIRELRTNLTIKVFIPTLTSQPAESSLSYLLLQEKIPFQYFNYNPRLFEFSRYGDNGIRALINLPGLLLQSMLELRRLNIPNSSLIWCNGNKVGLIWLFYRALFCLPNQIVWHFRDYPETSGIFALLWPVIGLFSRFWSKQYFVANSHSVATAIAVSFRRDCAHVIYNPIGLLKSTPRQWQQGELILGSASMLAPWKGIYELIQTVQTYSTQLQELGVKEFHIYGETPYHTKGEHLGHAQQIEKLIADGIQSCKIPIVLKGVATPSVIFSSLNILIHSSKRPEPFGRILVEAFCAQVLVVTTGLGGAGEIAIAQDNCLHYEVAHPSTLIVALQRLIKDEQFRQDLQVRALQSAHRIEDKATQDLKKMLDKLFA
jgi:glycosyltransferase involved in cell wall biosynthesis